MENRIRLKTAFKNYSVFIRLLNYLKFSHLLYKDYFILVCKLVDSFW